MNEFKKYKAEKEKLPEEKTETNAHKFSSKNKENIKVCKKKLHDKEIKEKEKNKRKEERRKANQEWDNLSKSEKKGLMSLRKRIKKGEIVVLKSDKSSKLCVIKIDKHLQVGINKSRFEVYHRGRGRL